MSKTIDLEAIEAIERDTMPGPWIASREEHGWHIGPQPDGACSIFENTDSSTWPAQQARANFIAGSREWVPALVAEVRRLHALAEARRLDYEAARHNAFLQEKRATTAETRVHDLEVALGKAVHIADRAHFALAGAGVPRAVIGDDFAALDALRP